MLVVDPRHWLMEDGDLPKTNLRLRRQALRVARLIEYGGPLAVGESRETLVECTKRPARQPCLSLMWVVKTEEHAIYAYCPVCKQDEVMIHGWEDTLWAEGMMEPLPPPDSTVQTRGN
jgi:hypothetical protein